MRFFYLPFYLGLLKTGIQHDYVAVTEDLLSSFTFVNYFAKTSKDMKKYKKLF